MGAYRWKRVVDVIDGFRVPGWERAYDAKATAACDHCEDYGEWIGESGFVEPCPTCGGRNARPPTRKDLDAAGAAEEG